MNSTSVADTNPVRGRSVGVVNDAESVSINQDSITTLATHLVNEFKFTPASWDAPVFPSLESHSIETVVDFMVVGNAVNYCFNDLDTGEKFTVAYMGDEWRGSYGMWASLHRALVGDVDVFDADYLQTVSESDVAEIFEPVDGKEIPMPESRVEQLNAVGELMEECGGTFRDKFTGEINIYGDDGVVEWLANTDAYRDESKYNEIPIRFDKRAQLVVSMLYSKLQGTNHEFSIVDKEAFTVFADYGIPAGLVANDVLDYDNELAEKIANGEEIESGSKEEIEIRAATVYVGDQLIHVLNDVHGIDVGMPVLDYVLWQMRNDADTQAHLTETTAY